MVKAYLENYQNELMQKKIILERECHELRTKLKENFQFIMLLEKEENPDYESFTPREFNQKNWQKIQKLKKEQMEIQNEAEEKAYELSDIENRLAELSSVIKIARKNEVAFTEKIENEDALGLKFLETQEMERQRIARDLHDSTVQSLTGMIYKTELCSKLVDTNTERCKQELNNVSKALHDIVNEMRDLIYNLHPMSYDDMGLYTTVKKEFSKLETDGNIELHYHIKGNLNDIKPVISLTLFRIVQELCNNILKHADAKNVDVSFVRKEDNLSITIQDDGKGFRMDKLQNQVREDHSGFGISIMRERIYLLSGNFDIKSSEGEGTRVKISVPLN